MAEVDNPTDSSEAMRATPTSEVLSREQISYTSCTLASADHFSQAFLYGNGEDGIPMGFGRVDVVGMRSGLSGGEITEARQRWVSGVMGGERGDEIREYSRDTLGLEENQIQDSDVMVTVIEQYMYEMGEVSEEEVFRRIIDEIKKDGKVKSGEYSPGLIQTVEHYSQPFLYGNGDDGIPKGFGRVDFFAMRAGLSGGELMSAREQWVQGFMGGERGDEIREYARGTLGLAEIQIDDPDAMVTVIEQWLYEMGEERNDEEIGRIVYEVRRNRIKNLLALAKVKTAERTPPPPTPKTLQEILQSPDRGSLETHMVLIHRLLETSRNLHAEGKVIAGITSGEVSLGADDTLIVSEEARQQLTPEAQKKEMIEIARYAIKLLSGADPAAYDFESGEVALYEISEEEDPKDEAQTGAYIAKQIAEMTANEMLSEDPKSDTLHAQLLKITSICKDGIKIFENQDQKAITDQLEDLVIDVDMEPDPIVSGLLKNFFLQIARDTGKEEVSSKVPGLFGSIPTDPINPAITFAKVRDISGSFKELKRNQSQLVSKLDSRYLHAVEFLEGETSIPPGLSSQEYQKFISYFIADRHTGDESLRYVAERNGITHSVKADGGLEFSETFQTLPEHMKSVYIESVAISSRIEAQECIDKKNYADAHRLLSTSKNAISFLPKPHRRALEHTYQNLRHKNLQAQIDYTEQMLGVSLDGLLEQNAALKSTIEALGNATQNRIGEPIDSIPSIPYSVEKIREAVMKKRVELAARPKAGEVTREKLPFEILGLPTNIEPVKLLGQGQTADLGAVLMKDADAGTYFVLKMSANQEMAHTLDEELALLARWSNLPDGYTGALPPRIYGLDQSILRVEKKGKEVGPVSVLGMTFAEGSTMDQINREIISEKKEKRTALQIAHGYTLNRRMDVLAQIGRFNRQLLHTEGKVDHDMQPRNYYFNTSEGRVTKIDSNMNKDLTFDSLRTEFCGYLNNVIRTVGSPSIDLSDILENGVDFSNTLTEEMVWSPSAQSLLEFVYMRMQSVKTIEDVMGVYDQVIEFLEAGRDLGTPESESDIAERLNISTILEGDHAGMYENLIRDRIEEIGITDPEKKMNLMRSSMTGLLSEKRKTKEAAIESLLLNVATGDKAQVLGQTELLRTTLVHRPFDLRIQRMRGLVGGVEQSILPENQLAIVKALYDETPETGHTIFLQSNISHTVVEGRVVESPELQAASDDVKCLYYETQARMLFAETERMIRERQYSQAQSKTEEIMKCLQQMTPRYRNMVMSTYPQFSTQILQSRYNEITVRGDHEIVVLMEENENLGRLHELLEKNAKDNLRGKINE